MTQAQFGYPFIREERTVVMRNAVVTAVSADGRRADVGQLKNLPIHNVTGVAVGVTVLVLLDRDHSLIIGAYGAIGADGPIGPPGPAGPAGPTGPTGPEGPEGDAGPAGATGPPGPSAVTGAGVPADAVGVTGQFYVDTTTKALYGPKTDVATAGTPGQRLLAALPAPNTSNPGPIEVGTQFVVTGGEVDLTAIRFFRHTTDTELTKTVKVWNVTGQVQIHATTKTLSHLALGWNTITLDAPQRLGPGNYQVSHGTTTPASAVSFLNPGPAVASVWNVSFVGWRYVLTAGAYPNINTALGVYSDPVFTPVTKWPIAGLDPIPPAKVDYFLGRVLSPVVNDAFVWTKPAGARLVQVILQGPGGSGASGRRGAPGTIRSGGGGGSGGMRREFWIAASDLPSTVQVTVSSAPVGAPAVTTDDTNGVDGGAAGLVDFKVTSATTNQFTTFGGGSGYGGTIAGGTGIGGQGSIGVGPGGGGGPVGVTASIASIAVAAFGGGGGGGVSAANAFGPGGTSYRGQFLNAEYGVDAGGAVDGAAGAAVAIPNFPGVPPYPWGFGGGGGGGAGSVAGPGGRGANGIRGGGGGGGGGSTNGQPSGAGGDGGPGYVMVITYF